MNSQTPSDGPPGFWSSLFTEEASFRGGQFNFWAVAETILAICGFWVQRPVMAIRQLRRRFALKPRRKAGV